MNQATRDFIEAHAGDDVRQLALRGSQSPGVELPFALSQIAGRQTARKKLPTWAATDGIVYPPHLSMEQCSSELTARYKAALAGTGQRLVDLTGGFGVDFAWMAPGFTQAVYVEQQPQLCAISSENFQLLGLRHAEVTCADATDFLHRLDHASLIYIDPARRDAHGGRTYGIADCTPNVLVLLGELMQKTSRLLLKLSPMLDWRKAVGDIQGALRQTVLTQTVHIVSVDNECKELLVEVRREELAVERAVRVVCVNLSSEGREDRFEFSLAANDDGGGLSPVTVPVAEEPSPRTDFSWSESICLFEPNASVMKAGCFSLLARRFGVLQLGANSHLFVATGDVGDFPGRRFAVVHITTLNKRAQKEALAGVTHANITVRNFPLSVADLRRRLKLKDGGDLYIFATTVADGGHQLFICRKIG